MNNDVHSIRTNRLLLRAWQDTDRDSFAAMSDDPEVMADIGGPLDRSESDKKFDRYVTAFEKYGFCRWALENLKGQFIGYAGVMPSRPGHPLGPHADIGWRLVRTAWGHGYATEAAAAALADIFERVGLNEVLAYTAPDNLRSQAVMHRLGLQRAASLDFSGSLGINMWRGLVWVARP